MCDAPFACKPANTRSRASPLRERFGECSPPEGAGGGMAKPASRLTDLPTSISGSFCRPSVLTATTITPATDAILPAARDLIGDQAGFRPRAEKSQARLASLAMRAASGDKSFERWTA